MATTCILDTNVLLHDPEALACFGDSTVLIPVAVLEELDAFKRDATELGRNARQVTQALDELAQTGRLGEGVALPDGGLLQIRPGVDEDLVGCHGLSLTRKVGHQLLNLALYLATHRPETAVILVTKNVNLRLKADALGIFAEDYEVGRRAEALTEQYMGWHRVDVSAEFVDAFYANGKASLEIPEAAPGEYAILMVDGKPQAAGKVGNGGIYTTQAPDDGICGIEARNFEQQCAIDALLDDSIKLVTLSGRAGTGKTLVAVAAGLHKVIHESVYTKLLISRPTLPMGRDIGFIPGDVHEKMRPWIQPLYDAIELIRDQDRRRHRRTLPPDIMESDDIGIEPLTYIRGRSIPKQFFIIDEAQNLTPHEMKTVITRVGQNSKVIVTGDPEQIDNPYVDLHSNGFSYLVSRFRTQPISAHIVLVAGERGELAEIASRIM